MEEAHTQAQQREQELTERVEQLEVDKKNLGDHLEEFTEVNKRQVGSCMHPYTHTHTHTHVHPPTHTHMCTHTHTHNDHYSLYCRCPSLKLRSQV